MTNLPSFGSYTKKLIFLLKLDVIEEKEKLFDNYLADDEIGLKLLPSFKSNIFRLIFWPLLKDLSKQVVQLSMSSLQVRTDEDADV